MGNLGVFLTLKARQNYQLGRDLEFGKVTRSVFCKSENKMTVKKMRLPVFLLSSLGLFSLDLLTFLVRPGLLTKIEIRETALRPSTLLPFLFSHPPGEGETA